MTSKHDLRQTITERLSRLTEADCRQASSAACDRLRALSLVLNAMAFAFYVPIQWELNLMPLAEEFLKTHKTIAFPRHSADCQRYEMAVVSSMANDFIAGKYAIPEPGPQCPEWSFSNDSNRVVWFVPGLGFDTNGNRLGRGGGHYDRLLSDTNNNLLIGIAHECQMVEAVPVDAHDVKMDIIVTGRTTYDCRARTNT